MAQQFQQRSRGGGQSADLLVLATNGSGALSSVWGLLPGCSRSESPAQLPLLGWHLELVEHSVVLWQRSFVLFLNSGITRHGWIVGECL